jgi:hypothetical protein
LKRNLVTTIAAALLIFAGQARAGVVAYTSQAAFNAASTNLTSVNFNGLAPVGGFTYYGDSLTVGALNFSGTGGFRLFVIDPGFAPPSWSYNSGNQVLTDNFGVPFFGGSGLTTFFPAGTTAASLLIGDFSSTTATITLSTGDVFTVPITGQPNLDFYGFTSTTPITSINLTDLIGAPVIDTVQYGQAVPEPTSLALLGIGAVSMVGYGRRWMRKRA